MTTNSPAGQTHQIVGGPNIDMLVDAFKYAFTDRSNIYIAFEIEDSKGSAHYNAQIVGIRYESGAPGMVIVTANLPYYSTIDLFYNANTRKGSFVF